jgi:cytochrome c peroxidase
MFMKKTTLVLLGLFSFNLLASDALISLGERLFNDGRFSRYFWQNSQGKVNTVLKNGETHLDVLVTPLGAVASPFMGETTSCASCHMVDQAFGGPSDPGMRTYSDFAPITPIPSRPDLRTHTARNTPVLVGIGSLYKTNRFSHWDGEFSDHSETVLGNFTGRNMGWLKSESQSALKNIVTVLREDNGQTHLGPEFGGSYEFVFRSNASTPSEFRLAPSERVDFKKASDQEVILAVTNAVTAYLNDLDFQKNEKGEYNGSPFDQFLLTNGFSTVPKKGEASIDFTERLRAFLENLKRPKFVAEKDFPTHNKLFGFGHRELQGAKIFFNLPNHSGNKGSCFKCHTAPLYSDQSFHNIGTSQAIYDELHGFGAFLQKYIPKEEYRGDFYLNQAADRNDAKKMDLGLWNFYNRNTEVTEFFKKKNCLNSPCSLEMTIGRFKTAGLRDLAHSNPYFHHGRMADLIGVLAHYMKIGIQAREGLTRNPDPILKEIQINGRGLPYLHGFLNSLNEDYE